jgi:hypothetical protein
LGLKELIPDDDGEEDDDEEDDDDDDDPELSEAPVHVFTNVASAPPPSIVISLQDILKSIFIKESLNASKISLK